MERRDEEPIRKMLSDQAFVKRHRCAHVPATKGGAAFGMRTSLLEIQNMHCSQNGSLLPRPAHSQDHREVGVLIREQPL